MLPYLAQPDTIVLHKIMSTKIMSTIAQLPLLAPRRCSIVGRRPAVQQDGEPGRAQAFDRALCQQTILKAASRQSHACDANLPCRLDDSVDQGGMDLAAMTPVATPRS